MALFALGFFITIIQIIRIFTIKHLKTYTDSEAIVLWSQVEISLGVIIACVPTYGPYFHAFASTLTSSYNTRRQRRQHASQSQTMDPSRSYALSGGRRTQRNQSRMLPSETDDQAEFLELGEASAGRNRPWDNSVAVTTTIGHGDGDSSSDGGRSSLGSGRGRGSEEGKDGNGPLEIQRVVEVEVRVD
ncbi:hypothetical protein AbraCBS73388_002828 [Aspergillus brasiliensis]|uniref:Rhodopsin domain-containing protein n=1 Tax=Aspergillus brasiliensis TaxID=319629 RepID=A0A9W6DR63_9EURO|nr:hypothetical protein AbraCBS73388_002828 [Aspergillus brasiliensis]